MGPPTASFLLICPIFRVYLTNLACFGAPRYYRLRALVALCDPSLTPDGALAHISDCELIPVIDPMAEPLHGGANRFCSDRSGDKI